MKSLGTPTTKLFLVLISKGFKFLLVCFCLTSRIKGLKFKQIKEVIETNQNRLFAAVEQ